MTKSDDGHDFTSAMHEFGSVLPTSRHAEVLFDGIVALLGDDAWIEEPGTQRHVFRRDPENPELLIPWPLLRFALGSHIAGRGEFQVGGMETAGPFEPIAPPSKLRGLKKAELVISWGASFTLAYNEEGRLFEVSVGAGGLAGDMAALLEELCAAKREERGVEGLGARRLTPP